ncbi:hypothetical protein U0070_009399, partial [Myodes glareolus]
MGLTDWMEKMDFMDFVGEREKKVTLALRAAQVPEVPLGKMERRASQGILTRQHYQRPEGRQRRPRKPRNGRPEGTSGSLGGSRRPGASRCTGTGRTTRPTGVQWKPRRERRRRRPRVSGT